MKSIVLAPSLEDKIELRSKEIHLPKEGQVQIKIKAAALNHRDEWARKGLYPNLKEGVTLGSDGAGEVVALGKGVEGTWLGREVIINPAIHWGENQKVQGENFEILGMPSEGTLAEFINCSLDRLHQKPSHMTWEEAAALPLAGLTAYRALFYKGEATPSDSILVTGFGGGVAQFAAQFALALGGKIAVTSSQQSKLMKAEELGIQHTFNYREEGWVKKAISETGGFDLIIDGAVGDSFSDLLKVTKPGGRIVFYGATAGNPTGLDARRIFWNQIQVKGTTMGSDQDFLDMIEFVTKHKIKPIIDEVFPLENAVDAFEKMKAGSQMGKLVLVP